MKKYFLGTLTVFLFSLTSFCSAFSWDFSGWKDNYGQITDASGNLVWPHMEKTGAFQKAYNDELSALQTEGKCLEIELLEKIDKKYGPLTDDARKFVESEHIPDKCKVIKEETKLPPVTNGHILPGPEFGEDGKSYVMNQLLPGITNWILVSITAISVIMGIIAGLFYITSSGDTEMTKKGKDIMIWSIAGLVLAILSFTIVKIIININFLS